MTEQRVENPYSIPIRRISLEGAEDPFLTEDDVLRRQLKKAGLFNKNYAYSAFDPKITDRVLTTGTTHKQGKKEKIT